MADFLGTSDEPTVMTRDYLGVDTPLAFKGKQALPAGGPITGGTAPSTVSGGGAAAPGVAGGGGTSAQKRASEALDALGLTARALGISEQALKASDWARRLFASDESSSRAGGANPDVSAGTRSVESGAAFPGETMGELSSLSRLTPADYGLAAEAEMGAAESAGGGASVGGGLGILGGLLTTAGSMAGNRDVTRAGQATTAAGAGAELGAGLAGAGTAGIAFAPAALGYAGMSLAQGFDQEAQIRSDTHSAKNVLGAKVPAAMSRLNKTLTDANGIDIASAPVEQLMQMQQDLQTARGEFNAVDHAFKGGITIAGKNIESGLSMDQVKPYLDQLNETQLRIQDALESRGVPSDKIPGYQSPLDWLNFIDGPAFQQYTYGTEKVDQMQGLVEGRADTPDPRITQAMQGMQPGQTEAGLRDLERTLAGQSVASREPDPSAPMTEPSTGALEQLASFGLLPGGGAARGEEVLESA